MSWFDPPFSETPRSLQGDRAIGPASHGRLLGLDLGIRCRLHRGDSTEKGEHESEIASRIYDIWIWNDLDMSWDQTMLIC